MEGKATIAYKNGDEYLGCVEKSKINGPGFYKYSDGHSLVGRFVNGAIQEKGKKVYSDGRVYIGELKGGIECGSGITTGGRECLNEGGEEMS
jgi:hypothetical protein